VLRVQVPAVGIQWVQWSPTDPHMWQQTLILSDILPHPYSSSVAPARTFAIAEQVTCSRIKSLGLLWLLLLVQVCFPKGTSGVRPRGFEASVCASSLYAWKKKETHAESEVRRLSCTVPLVCYSDPYSTVLYCAVLCCAVLCPFQVAQLQAAGLIKGAPWRTRWCAARGAAGWSPCAPPTSPWPQAAGPQLGTSPCWRTRGTRAYPARTSWPTRCGSRGHTVGFVCGFCHNVGFVFWLEDWSLCARAAVLAVSDLCFGACFLYTPCAALCMVLVHFHVSLCWRLGVDPLQPALCTV